MVMYKPASSLLEDHWLLAATDRLHPLKLAKSGVDVAANILPFNMPVPVRAFTPQPEEFRLEFASLSNGNSLSLIPPRVTALKEGRQNPHRQRLPKVRTPPSDLWNLLDVKSPTPLQHTTSYPCGPTLPSDGSTLHSNAHKSAVMGDSIVADRRPPVPMKRQSPIGTGRPHGNESGSRQWEGRTIQECSNPAATPSSRLSPHSPTSDDTILVSLSPGIAGRRRTPPSRSFYDVLLENKRRHPHAPTMVSKLNPLRDQVSFRAWTCIPVQPTGKRSADMLALPSARYQTSLSSLLYDTRSRQSCDLASSNLRANKRIYLRKNSYHCSHCKRDSIHKKLLVLLYFGHHLRSLFNKPSYHSRSSRPFNALRLNTESGLSSLMGGPAMVVDSDSLMAQEESILDTPILKDLDDFDDYENALDDMDEGVLANEDHSLLLEQIDADGDTKMHDAP